MIRGVLLLITIAIAMATGANSALAKRIALVIGNSAYQNVSRLDNPRNDAALIAKTLQGLGFSLIGQGAQDEPEESKKSPTSTTLTQGSKQTGLQSYIPPEPQNDKALAKALELVRASKAAGRAKR